MTSNSTNTCHYCLLKLCVLLVISHIVRGKIILIAILRRIVAFRLLLKVVRDILKIWVIAGASCLPFGFFLFMRHLFFNEFLFFSWNLFSIILIYSWVIFRRYLIITVLRRWIVRLIDIFRCRLKTIFWSGLINIMWRLKVIRRTCVITIRRSLVSMIKCYFISNRLRVWIWVCINLRVVSVIFYGGTIFIVRYIFIRAQSSNWIFLSLIYLCCNFFISIINISRAIFVWISVSIKSIWLRARVNYFCLVNRGLLIGITAWIQILRFFISRLNFINWSLSIQLLVSRFILIFL